MGWSFALLTTMHHVYCVTIYRDFDASLDFRDWKPQLLVVLLAIGVGILMIIAKVALIRYY